jgi:hypothetical protein
MSRISMLVAAVMMVACATDDGLDDLDGDGKADGPGVSNVPFAVSRHTWPSDNKEAVTRDLKLIAELGAKYVRTDVWWYSIEPNRGQYNQGALDYYRWYVEEAGRNGLEVVLIISGAPEWANELYRTGKVSEFTTAFGAYSEKVAAKVGDLIPLWQLWNEPNNVVDLPNGDTDAQLMRQGRAGIERGRAAIGATIPFRTAINVLVDGHDGFWGRWEDDLRHYLNHGARDAVDVLTIDHYPGTWSIGDWGGNIIDRLFALGKEQGKAVGIFETGYATSNCVLPLNTEGGQADWIRNQLPRMRAKLFDRRVTQGVGFTLVNWFKIEDRNSGNCWDPEDRFGIVRTDRSKKPGFDLLRAEIAKFSP